MKKEQLREGLKKLDAYIQKLDFSGTFLEEDSTMPMDTLVIPLQVGEDLSIDISCNFVELESLGNILQFYGQIVLNEILEETGITVAEADIVYLLNELNRLIPTGQFLYLCEEEPQDTQKMIGIRYTMLTELDNETELRKCGNVLLLLMQAYELLCSSLLLLFDGNSVEEVMRTIHELLG